MASTFGSAGSRSPRLPYTNITLGLQGKPLFPVAPDPAPLARREASPDLDTERLLPETGSVAGADEEEVAGLVAGELDRGVLGNLRVVDALLGPRRHPELEMAEHLLAQEHA